MKERNLIGGNVTPQEGVTLATWTGTWTCTCRARARDNSVSAADGARAQARAGFLRSARAVCLHNQQYSSRLSHFHTHTFIDLSPLVWYHHRTRTQSTS